MKREQFPSFAFAHVMKVGDEEFRLLRHHSENATSADDHGSVDVELLDFSLSMLDQLPVDEATKASIKAHLESHQAALAATAPGKDRKLEMTEDAAKALLNQQIAGKDGNEALNKPAEESLPADPELTTVDASKADVNDVKEIPGQNSPNGSLTDGDSLVNNPNKDKTDDQPKSPPAGAKKQALTDGDKLADNPNKDKLGKASVMKKKSLVKNEEDGRVALIVSKNGDVCEAQVASSRDKIVIKPEDKNWKVLCQANSQKGMPIAFEAGLVVTNDPELLEKLGNSKSALVNGKLMFLDGEVILNNPNKDKLGKASILYASLNDCSQEILDKLAENMKSVSETSIVKLASVDYAVIDISKEGEYAMYAYLKLHRDEKGDLQIIEIEDTYIPVKAKDEFAAALKSVSASIKEPELSESPAKLERCVSDVMTKKKADFRKKNGRNPNAKEVKKMESSAYAICNSSVKK